MEEISQYLPPRIYVNFIENFCITPDPGLIGKSAKAGGTDIGPPICFRYHTEIFFRPILENHQRTSDSFLMNSQTVHCFYI